MNVARLTRYALLTWCLATVAAVAGCAAPDDQVYVRDPPYAWGIQNRSSKVFSPQTTSTYVVKGQSFQGAFGALRPGTSRASAGGRDPIPDSIHLHWIDEATGAAHDIDVPVRGRVPDEAHFTGTLWLVVTDDGVTLEPGTDPWYGIG